MNDKLELMQNGINAVYTNKGTSFVVGSVAAGLTITFGIIAVGAFANAFKKDHKENVEE